jgi:hypothetical protein
LHIAETFDPFRDRPTLPTSEVVGLSSSMAVFGIAILVARKRPRQSEITNFGLKNLKVIVAVMPPKSGNFGLKDSEYYWFGSAN